MSSDSDEQGTSGGTRPLPNPLPEGEGTRPPVLDYAQQTKDLFRRLGPAAPMAMAVMFLPPLGLSGLITLVSTTSIAGTMRDHPAAAMPLYIAAFWFLGICCLPTYAYSVLGGWAFGFWGGFFAASLAYAGAMIAAFAITRRYASARVLPLIAQHPLLAAVQSAVVNTGRVRGSLLIALLRISPASPFAITNAVLGAGGVGWTQYIVGSSLGVLPRTLVVVYFASTLEQLEFTSGEGWWMITLGIIATVIVVGIIGRLARRELDRQLKR